MKLAHARVVCPPFFFNLKKRNPETQLTSHAATHSLAGFFFCLRTINFVLKIHYGQRMGSKLDRA